MAQREKGSFEDAHITCTCGRSPSGRRRGLLLSEGRGRGPVWETSLEREPPKPHQTSGPAGTACRHQTITTEWSNGLAMRSQGISILRVVLFLCYLQIAGGSRRSAGGLGPELRSRVTQALDELEKAVMAQPENAQLWWQLGVHSQIAAGGVVEQERYSVAMLERAVLLDKKLLESYANVILALPSIHSALRGWALK